MPEEKTKKLPENFERTINYVNKELLGFPPSKKNQMILDSPLDAQAVYEKTVIPAVESGELAVKKDKKEKTSLLKKLFNRKKDAKDNDQKLFDDVSSVDESKFISFIGKKYDVEEIKARRDIELKINGLEQSGVEMFVKQKLIQKGKEGVAPVSKEEVMTEAKKEAAKNSGFQTEHIEESRKKFSDGIKSRKSGSSFDSKKNESFLESIKEEEDRELVL